MAEIVRSSAVYDDHANGLEATTSFLVPEISMGSGSGLPTAPAALDRTIPLDLGRAVLVCGQPATGTVDLPR